MPAQAGIQGREGGWIPACAGMTEQRVVVDAQIIAARVFSKEARRIRKVLFRTSCSSCLRGEHNPCFIFDCYYSAPRLGITRAKSAMVTASNTMALIANDQ